MNTSRIDESKTKHSKFTSNIYFDVGMVYVLSLKKLRHVKSIKCLQINNNDKLYTISSKNYSYNNDIKIIRYFIPT